MAQQGWANPNRVNTPITRSFSAPETVTVIDPRHPLHNQTFALLHLKNKQELIPCCLVRLAAGATRLIPVNVTNLSQTPPDVFPLPVDVSSLHELTQVFVRIAAQLEVERRDEGTNKTSPGADRNDPAASMANADSNPAADGLANNRASMSPSRPAVVSGEEK